MAQLRYATQKEVKRMFEAVIDFIARTNLFNFIIFAGIIAYIFIKLNIAESLDKSAANVAEKIEESKSAKEQSEEHLKTIEDKVALLSNEIASIIEQSENNAKIVGEKIMLDANKTAENIHNNSLKLINNKTAVLKNDIMQRASLASVEVAKEHILQELNNNNDLHNRLIDESIAAIDKVEL